MANKNKSSCFSLIRTSSGELIVLLSVPGTDDTMFIDETEFRGKAPGRALKAKVALGTHRQKSPKEIFMVLFGLCFGKAGIQVCETKKHPTSDAFEKTTTATIRSG